MGIRRFRFPPAYPPQLLCGYRALQTPESGAGPTGPSMRAGPIRTTPAFTRGRPSGPASCPGGFLLTGRGRFLLSRQKKMGADSPETFRSPSRPTGEKRRAATRSPPLLCAVIRLEMPLLSGDLLHGEGLADVACPGKLPFSRDPGGRHPRRAEPACGKVSACAKTLGPADAGRRAAAREGDGKTAKERRRSVIWGSPPW